MISNDITNGKKTVTVYIIIVTKFCTFDIKKKYTRTDYYINILLKVQYLYDTVDSEIIAKMGYNCNKVNLYFEISSVI